MTGCRLWVTSPPQHTWLYPPLPHPQIMLFQPLWPLWISKHNLVVPNDQMTTYRAPCLHSMRCTALPSFSSLSGSWPLSRTIPMTHPCDLLLPLITYGKDPTPTLSFAEHNKTKKHKSAYCFLGLPRLSPLALASPTHNNIQLWLQLPYLLSPSLLCLLSFPDYLVHFF